MAVPANPPPAPPLTASECLRAFIARALVKDPDERPTAAELLQHEFVTQMSERAAAEILRGLAGRFIAVKAHADAAEPEEEDEEEDDGEPDPRFRETLRATAATILFNEATKGTMVVGDRAASQLQDWKPQMAGVKATPKIVQAQKRIFGNFSVPDLDLMLSSVRDLALQELKKGAVPQDVVRTNYEEVRAGIIAELRRKKKPVPDSYQELDR
jgi:serine/threonine protein kinase